MKRYVGLVFFFPASAFAQAAQPSLTASLTQMAPPLVAILVVFYFLLIRPQSQRLKEQQAMLAALKKGDDVLTAGGILGKVTKVGDGDTVTIEIAKSVEVNVLKNTIGSVMNRDAVKTTIPAPKKKTAEKNDNVVPSKDQIANDN